MIEIKDLDFAFQSKSPVLQGINLSIAQGAFIVLAGANGSGKSTLLALLAGLYLPQAGSINFGDALGLGGQALQRSRVGFLLQDADLQILGGTVREDILLGYASEQTELEQKAKALASRFDLLQYWDLPVQNLSGGEKKKLCLAAALMRSPQVLLFDEPFNNLDYPALKELRQIMSVQKKSGVTQVIASHDLEPVLDLVDEIVILDQGRLACQGSPEQILDRLQEFGIRTPCNWGLQKSLCSWNRNINTI